MKKVIIPCLAATLFIGSTTAANEAGAKPSGTAVVHKMENKKHGLENALEQVKNPIAQEAIKRNLERLKKHKKDDQDNGDKETEKENTILSTFTISGEDVRYLAGLTSKDGAVLKVDSFHTFSGITAVAKDKKAKVTVSLNNSTVSKDYLENIPLRANDVIVVTVENGDTKQNYKVTLVESEEISLNKFTIGGVDVLSLQGITSSSGAILKVDSFHHFKGITAEAKKDAEVKITLNGHTVHQDYLAQVPLRADDVIVAAVTEGNTTQIHKVTLKQK